MSVNSSFHIMLVEPRDSLNIGAAARAMMNLGFRELHLVQPANFDPLVAARTACWAEPLIAAARLHDNLAEAVAPLHEVVGFSCRAGRNRPALLLEEWLSELEQTRSAKVGLLFGPEDTGLRDEHLEHCRRTVTIPSASEYPSFNLAQAVLLVLWELYKRKPAVSTEQSAAATGADYTHLDRLIEETARRSGFFRTGTPKPVPRLIKNLFRRIQPDIREMGLLLGLLGRINRALAGKVPTVPLADDEH